MVLFTGIIFQINIYNRSKTIRRSTYTVRKTHRYLGKFIGIQLLLWTVSGLYFNWINIDDIHGEYFKKTDYQAKTFHKLLSP